MRIHLVPPPSLLRAFRPRGDSPAAVVHECYARSVWQARGFQSRLEILAALPLWPTLNLLALLWFTGWNGPWVKRTHGKGLLRQVAEQLDVLLRHSISSPWYYIYGLHDDARRRRAGQYIHRFETKQAIFTLLKNRLGGWSGSLNDKSRFDRFCRENGLPAAPVILVLEGGAVRGHEGAAPMLPECDLFVKPLVGQGGRGAACWAYQGERRWRDRLGRTLSEAALIDALGRRSRRRAQIVQPRIVNHPELADLACGALATARVVTILDESGGFEATHAALRMAVKRGAEVDNFHAGGIAAPVDMATGTLGQATGWGLLGMRNSGSPDWHAVHPATGAPIEGRRLPLWAETLELARRAHAAHRGVAVAGWDIALTKDGPLLVEGNSSPDLDIIQRTGRGPVGESRFGELLALHAKRALAREVPFDWRPGQVPRLGRPARSGPSRSRTR